MARSVTLLGIETSCDETAAAIIRAPLGAPPEGGIIGAGEIVSNVVLSQIEMHAPYGGVVPELAARAHLSQMDHLVARALDEANMSLQDVDAIAATSGPGLIGGVSGIWGPPTVMYLTAIALPKADKIRIQGVIYGLGAVALIVAHLGSGVLHSQVLTVSALLVAPTLLGFWVGDKFQGRINQATFRRLTLCIRLVAGLNLLRRGMGG